MRQPFHKIDASLLKIHHWPTLNMAKCRCKWGAREVDLFIANKSEFETRAHKYHKLSGIVFYGSWWKLFHLFISSQRDKVKKVTTTGICKADILPFPIKKKGSWHSKDMFYIRQRTLLKLYKTLFSFISLGDHLKSGLAAPPARLYWVSGAVPRLTRAPEYVASSFQTVFFSVPNLECMLLLASDIRQTLLKLSVLSSCWLWIYWSAGLSHRVWIMMGAGGDWWGYQ